MDQILHAGSERIIKAAGMQGLSMKLLHAAARNRRRLHAAKRTEH